MRVIIQPSYELVSSWVAAYLVRAIRDFNPSPSKPFVLGLPTGSSPIGTYRELIALHKKGKVSFKNVVTFNMDEYIGIREDHSESYHSFMWNNFFNHVDIQKKNVHILDGNAKDLGRECEEYEATIKKIGGIHLFLGGIGPDGHIAFNEPGSSLGSRTRIKTLTEQTIKDNARFFKTLSEVPRLAITMGIGTIMEAKELIMLASKANKADAVKAAVEGPITAMVPASILQMHRNAYVIVDKDAASKITHEFVG